MFLHEPLTEVTWPNTHSFYTAPTAAPTSLLVPLVDVRVGFMSTSLV